MCGIAGVYAPAAPGLATPAHARAMGLAIAHRGPDGAAEWSDPAHGIAFAHRRLAIVGLGPCGAQPMASHCGRWRIAFNGEIYNFEAIRAELDALGHPGWHGTSDTEVLVEAVARWGIDATLPRLTGMFAVALWDARDAELTLIRDRIGEKPLYWGRQGDAWLFGSELKAIAAHPAFERRLDPAAARAMLRFAYVPAPRSIWAGIAKLRPGELVSIGADGPRVRRWWTLPRPDPRASTLAAETDRFEAVIGASVARQMRADVPMGAFLSGGIDSSTIVALMQRHAAQPVRTFSIGFDNAAFDESAAAAAVAAHLGTRHTTLTATAADALALVPALPDMYDEPFADASQIPTHLLARLTREHVTVALSGDGGDELFAGYARHISFETLWGRLARMPGPARRLAAAALGAVPATTMRGLARAIAGPVGRALTPGRIAKLVRAMRARDPQQYYASLVEYWPGPPDDFDKQDIARDYAHPVLGMQHVDQATYLPDDILVKVDRATMAVALEARVPLLDHAVVEAAARLPLDLRTHGGVGKRVLRAVLDRHVPRALIDRPKQGFAMPVADWLRGPLAAWAGALLARPHPALRDIIDAPAVARLWAEHRRGADHADRLWAVLMLNAWAERWQPL